LACSYGEFAELDRHSCVKPERADTVLVDEQSMSKEAISFDNNAEIRASNNLLTFLDQL